ncbi:MAG: hypothetical protein KDD61_07210 [Bdellovibrionales bacterium]|nr:hypothetical protein [Bdellovibrionales bacterium]
MKVLVFSPPFIGHFGVLKRMIHKYHQVEFKLAYTTWTNLLVEGEINLARSELKESLPANWTFPRVRELYEDCLNLAQEFLPDLIIYDFFSLEGHFVSHKLKIPCCCSIPSYIGANDLDKDIRRIVSENEVKDLFGELYEDFSFSVDRLEWIADGLHIPGDINIVWTYPSLVVDDFAAGRKLLDSYRFVGNFSNRIQGNRTHILISFGTVIMGNLWSKKLEIQSGMREFIQELARLASNENILFVTQGRHILDEYPKSWTVVNSIDQPRMLANSEMFITHGGSNSFHESVVQKTPMVAIPFNGDQHLVAATIDNKGLGTSIALHHSIEVDSEWNFLNSELAHKVIDSIDYIRRHMKQIEQNYEDLSLEPDSLSELF